ncbi:MAG: Toluene efflux pump periplasmic linker protein TtgA [Steroidobacteraceae bacterium]|nr:Toluene efflux pump periplasmic linker protein TtgA [Steroidobacteraceae bacterium]
MSFRPAFRVATFWVATGLLLGACGGGAPSHGPAAQPVTVVTLKSQPVTLTRELPARANPWLIAEVRPQVSGIVKQRLFTEGGTVKAGQPLYQLDDATYRADFASARATLARAEATLHSARLNATRSAELAKVDAVSRQDDENATAALLQAEADVKLAEANVRASGILLDYARITSPISGRIGKSSVTQGALVTANQAAALATVQQLDPMYVDATASSTELLALRRELAAGTLTSAALTVPVQVVLEDGSVYEHPGKLAFADVTVDPSTGTFLLRAAVPNPDRLLMPGMYVRAVISVGTRPEAILVPQQAIQRDPKGRTTALVVGADSKVEQREVQVSRTIGAQWLVESGLAAGDRVIVEGLQKVRPGMAVEATEARG